MPSKRDRLHLFLKGFLMLCARRKDGLEQGMERSIQSIILEIEDQGVPSLDALLAFEQAYDGLKTPDHHLKYLHGVLKGFRERQYRPPSYGNRQSTSR